MREMIKAALLRALPPVNTLFRHRNDLLAEVSVLSKQAFDLRDLANQRQKEIEALVSRSTEQQAALNEALGGLRAALPPQPYDFEADGMRLWDKNLKSLAEPAFLDAYQKGVSPGVAIQFRAYVCCWAARQALHIPGDFVECGVNEGWISLTICNLLNFGAVNKQFFLFDTYEGIPPEQIAPEEADRAALHNYPDCYEAAKRSFAPFPNAKLVRGRVPDTLTNVDIEKVSYLSIDMNIEYPERAAIEHFWPKLSPGGIVILDDYAFGGYDRQHDSMDEFAAGVGATILTLPTGQGLIIKA
jgi:hypothetical protein